MLKVTFTKVMDVVDFASQFKALPSFSQCEEGSWALVCRFRDLAEDATNLVLKTTKDFYTDNNGHELEQIVMDSMDSCISTWQIVNSSNYGVHKSNWLLSLDDKSKEDKAVVMNLVSTVSLMKTCRKALQGLS